MNQFLHQPRQGLTWNQPQSQLRLPQLFRPLHNSNPDAPSRKDNSMRSPRARVARSAKAATRKAEHARLSERITVEHFDSDEDVEHVIKRVRRKTAKSQDGGGEGNSAPTTEPAK